MQKTILWASETITRKMMERLMKRKVMSSFSAEKLLFATCVKVELT